MKIKNEAQSEKTDMIRMPLMPEKKMGARKKRGQKTRSFFKHAPWNAEKYTYKEMRISGLFLCFLTIDRRWKDAVK